MKYDYMPLKTIQVNGMECQKHYSMIKQIRLWKSFELVCLRYYIITLKKLGPIERSCVKEPSEMCKMANGNFLSIASNLISISFSYQFLLRKIFKECLHIEWNERKSAHVRPGQCFLLSLLTIRWKVIFTSEENSFWFRSVCRTYLFIDWHLMAWSSSTTFSFGYIFILISSSFFRSRPINWKRKLVAIEKIPFFQSVCLHCPHVADDVHSQNLRRERATRKRMWKKVNSRCDSPFTYLSHANNATTWTIEHRIHWICSAEWLAAMDTDSAQLGHIQMQFMQKKIIVTLCFLSAQQE